MITDVNGLVPVEDNVARQTISLSVSSISPNTAINPNGESTLTITGSNFPASLDDGSTLSVTFSDGTVCDV